MTDSALDRLDRDEMGPLVRTLDEQARHASSELLPCRIHDPELWFAESADKVEVAKAHCESCPVRQPCLAGALERREPWGVWGGQVFQQGTIVAHKRGRGRPRRDQVAPLVS